MSHPSSGPSTFSLYASRFLAGNRNTEDSRIFRPASPNLSSHDPFLPSPSASQSHPHLRGSSRSPSPTRTPPFPGPGINGIPNIDDGFGSGVGLLFADESDVPVPAALPNPYAPSSSSSDEVEVDLDEVAAVRRSLLMPKAVSDRAKKGWLAHQSVFPPSSSTSESDKETESDSGDEAPGDANLEQPLLDPDELDHVLEQPRSKIPVRLHLYHGRFGHWEREGLRKYKDSAFLALWITSLLGVLIGLLFVWGSTDPPKSPSRKAPSVVPILPLLLVLLIPTLVLPPAFLLLLRRTVRPVLLITAIFIPFSLFVCGWWAFGASFESLDTVESEKWWGTTGLRLCAVALWLLAVCFGRSVWIRRKRLDRAASVVELSTHLLLSHPPLLLLTPLLLGVFAVTSIPFLTLLIRLGTIGYWRQPRENTWVYHIRPYAGWLIFLVTVVWIWSWGVIRGIGRVAVAGVIGEWYFHRSEQAYPVPLDITVAAVHRATGTSLGSICLGAGIVATVRVIGRSAAELRRLTSPRLLPSPLMFMSHLTPVFAVVAGTLDQLNGYALVYVGITGDAFWPSARRAVGLVRRKGRLLDYTLIKLLLTLSSTAVGLFTATAGYLYMTHSLGNPSYAPVAALLCGGLPFLAIRAGASVLGDTADALFICHQIDSENGGGRCNEAKEAFAGEIKTGSNV